jgi:hypothetical protein
VPPGKERFRTGEAVRLRGGRQLAARVGGGLGPVSHRTPEVEESLSLHDPLDQAAKDEYVRFEPEELKALP